MTHSVDDVLTQLRTILGTPGLISAGKTYDLKRFPECPPMGVNTDSKDYPVIALELGDEQRDPQYSAGPHGVGVQFDVTISVIVHRDNVDANSTIETGYELSRKISGSIDDRLGSSGLDWGISAVQNTEWQTSGTDIGNTDPQNGLWVHTSIWNVTYATGY